MDPDDDFFMDYYLSEEDDEENGPGSHDGRVPSKMDWKLIGLFLVMGAIMIAILFCATLFYELFK